MGRIVNSIRPNNTAKSTPNTVIYDQITPTQCGRSTLLGGPVPSKHLFYSAGAVADDKQTCLLADNPECFVFLKANLM